MSGPRLLSLAPSGPGRSPGPAGRARVPEWKLVMIHHSATADGAVLDLAAIRHRHVAVRGWLDVGYHWIVERVGPGWEAVMGRPMTQPGAHCDRGGMNRRAVGVCLVGNFELGEPPPGQLARAAVLVRWLVRHIGPLVPEAITQHRDHDDTACPGARFDLAAFRRRVVVG